MIKLSAKDNAWKLQVATATIGISHLGLDTEGTGRQIHNLLREPLTLTWTRATAPLRKWSLEKTATGVVYHMILDYGRLDWQIETQGNAFVFKIQQEAWAPIYDLALTFNINQQYCPTAILPHDVVDNMKLVPPWLFVAPDHGHLYCEDLSPAGIRRPIGKRVPSERYRPVPWHATLAGQRGSHTLVWTLRAGRPFEKGDTAIFRFSPRPIKKPEGTDERLWKRIRRSWLNQFQANADENDVETPMMLANNVLSNPAVCCTAYYSDPMLLTPEPLPGINLPLLVRRTLDDWFANRVMGYGAVCSFAKYDAHTLYTNPMLIHAAWDYMQMTKDTAWLKKNTGQLRLVADYIVRRDQDLDGLSESVLSGNPWGLRDPDRSEFYLEYINFGHKNALTNALIYRAYHCMADLLQKAGDKKGARLYLALARKLQRVYAPTFYNSETGVLAGWISQDGKIHDYIFPFVNGVACAYGLVPREQGRMMLGRIIKKLKELKPKGWRWGVPVNLVPVPDFDLMQPGMGIGDQGIKYIKSRGMDLDYDEMGLPRLKDPDGAKSYRGRYDYNGATQTMLTAYLVMGCHAMGMEREAEWLLEPMMQAAAAGELQNGLHVKSGGGAEHHDWDGNPTGYEGYLPEGWYFLLAALMKNKNVYRRLLPFCFST